MTDPTDAELVEKTRSGDRDAYADLVARYQGHVYGLAYSLVDNWAEAQDIAQEAFIRAYCNLDQVQDPARFAAWLRRVAFSVAMDWLRTFRPGLFTQLDGKIDLDHLEIPDFKPGPPEVAQKRELADAVLATIASLPAKYRVPLTMFHLDGLSYQKVADFLDIPLGTAKSIIHRARAKLKAVLAAFATEEITPAVQEVFNEHKLPPEFARRVIEGVPTLGWDKGKQCTFAGALEAAMAVTKHAYTYADILGLTALAFRTRWFQAPEGRDWCGSCAVGEMEEEIAAAGKATGWECRVEVHPDIEKLSPEIRASIDAGKPIAAYDDSLDMAVLYGYDERGKTFLFRDYHKGEAPHELPASKVGWLWIFLGEHSDPPTPLQATVEAMRMAVHNYNREKGREGPGEYWYGCAAFDAWSRDLADVDSLTEEQRKKLLFVSWWNFQAMVNARKNAVAFLRERAELFAGAARDHLAHAAQSYQQEVDYFASPECARTDCFLDPGSENTMEKWTSDVRERERTVLSRARQIESIAIAEMTKALSSLR